MKKILIILPILIISTVSLFLIYRYSYNEKHVTILGYHGILPKNLNDTNSEFIIDEEEFERQLKFLKDNNYKTLTLKELLCWKNGECKKANKSIMITFDDGYLNNYEYAFSLLKKYNMNAVVFYIGENYEGKEGFMSLEDITKAKKEYPNIEFASHSYNLHEKNVDDYDLIVEDINKMKEIIDTEYYAYPHGEFSENYIKALKENNFKLAFTFGPDKEHRKCKKDDDNYKIPRLNIYNGLSLTKFKLRLFLPM